ncbi:hypothetical protein CBL_21253, partial [Carabus blaptoides fortunei]
PEKWIQNKIAGVEWLKSFMARQNDLSQRKPESTSPARASGFSRQKMKEESQRYKKTVKIVASIGKKQVGQIASAEKGELVTCVGIVSASGATIPPAYIYPRLRNPSNYLIDPPIGNGNYTSEESGDINLTSTSQVQTSIEVSQSRQNEEHELISTSISNAEINSPLTSQHENQDSTSPSKLKCNYLLVTPEQIRLFPKVIPRCNVKTNKRTAKSRIYTSTPEKDRLETMEKEKLRKQELKEQRKRKAVIKSLFVDSPKKIKSRKKYQSSFSSSDSDIELDLADSSNCEMWDELPEN